MKTATFVKNLKNFAGEAKLYKLSPPYRGWEFVVVSAAIAPFSGPETYIFGANEQGSIMDWLELPGSFQGELNHNKALENAGYVVK